MNRTEISNVVDHVVDDFLAKAQAARESRQRARRQIASDRSCGAMAKTFTAFQKNDATVHGVAARAHKRARRACMEAGFTLLAEYHSLCQDSHQILANERMRAARK